MKDLFYHNKEPLFSSDIEKLQEENSALSQARLLKWQNDFKETLCRTPAGRRVLWFLVHETYVFRKHGQSNAGAYKIDGKHELGQDIIDIIGPEELLRSLLEVKREAIKKEVEDERRSS